MKGGMEITTHRVRTHPEEYAESAAGKLLDPRR